MKHTINQEVLTQTATPQRVNFSDGNREKHLQVFYEWLPADLHEAPQIDWTKLPSYVIGYFVHTVGRSPFAGHLALAAGVASGLGIKARSVLGRMHHLSLLFRDLQTSWGVQSAADLTKDTWQTFVTQQKISPGTYNALKAYKTVTELHLPGYLEDLTPEQRACVARYILPRFPRRFLRQHFSDAAFREEVRQRRKSKSDILVPLHSLLVALVRLRKQAAERLHQAFQMAKEQVLRGEAQLPLLFSYEDELITVNQQARTMADIRLEKRPVTMRFRLWDHQHWITEHPEVYHPVHVRHMERQDPPSPLSSKRYFFVEFLGPEEDLLWFGEIIKYRLLQAKPCGFLPPKEAPHRARLLEKLGISAGLSCKRDGLLTPPAGVMYALSAAMARAESLLFEPEALYRGVLYAAALATLALTNGSRMAELLQVSADRFKVRAYRVQKEGQLTEKERVIHLQLLLPKGKKTEEQRKLFLISDNAYGFLSEIAQALRNAHDGHIPIVRPHPAHTKAEELPPERYLFQWDATPDGRWGALHSHDVQCLLRFIFYGLEFQTKQGKPFSVCTHLLRHVMATTARHEHEVSPTVLAHALHHEQRPGVLPESTEYYTQETEEQALITFAEFQTNLEEYATSLLVHWPNARELEQMDEDLRESFERWHTLLETTLGFCGNADLCPRGYNRTLCIGCPHLVPDPRKQQIALYWRTAYAKLTEELEAQGNLVDARQYRLLVQELDIHLKEMSVLQASIEDGTRKPVFLQLASAQYDVVVIDAEA